MASTEPAKPRKRSSVFNPTLSFNRKRGNDESATTRKRSSVLNMRMSTKRLVFQNPELEDVLENNHPEPFSKENFYHFLKEKMAEESLEFYENVQELKLYLEQKRNPIRSLNVVALDDKIEKKVNQIMDHYVSQGNARTINISGNVREKVLLTVKSIEDKSEIDTSIFDAAIGEIKRLMTADHFFIFVRKTKNTNISRKVSMERAWYGILFYVLGAASVAGIILVAQLLEIELLENPLWRLSSFPFMLAGSFNLISGAKRFCPRLCTLERYQNCPYCNLSDVWLGKDTNCRLKHTVQYQGLMKYFKARAKRTWMQIVILSALLTTAATIFTPGIFYDLPYKLN